MRSFLRNPILLLPLVHALPAPQVQQPGPSIVTENPVGPTGASGELRGPTNLAGYNPSNPAPTEPSTVVTDFTLAPGQDQDAELGLYLDLSQAENPQPIRGGTKAPTDPGPRTYEYDVLNPDIFAPPGTDAGDVPQAMWPLGLSHNRHGLQSAGWARQQNVNQLPSAVNMAGVDMRLEPNAYRELHWHTQNEWSYILNGSVRLSAVNEAGQTFTDDLHEGDVWFFPAGVPHAIQARENGVEFLLVFDDGSFSEDSTFLVSELFARNPTEVLAKNFRTDVSSFDNIPTDELYIFPGTPAPSNISAENITGPNGIIPPSLTYSYHFSQQQPYVVPGGSVKIIDSTTFPISDRFAAALITIEPGAMREIHWHTRSDEWNYFISGSARVTVFSAPEASRTFDFTAGDVGYIPVPEAHYIENTGNTTVTYLEILQAPVYNDISVGQWLGLTPPRIVKDHLNLPDNVIASLSKDKPFVVPGNPDLTTTNFTGNPE